MAPHWKPTHSFLVVMLELLTVANAVPSNVYVMVLVPRMTP